MTMQPPSSVEPVEDLLAERAAVEQARAFARQRLERAREVGLLQHEARLHGAGARGVDARPFRMQRLVAREFAGDGLHFLEVEFDQLEAVARDGDRRREEFRQLLLAVRAVQFAPAGEIARCADRQRAALEL